MAYKLCFPVKQLSAPDIIVCYTVPGLRITVPKPDPPPFLARLASALRLLFSSEPTSWVPSNFARSAVPEVTIRDARLLATVDALTAEMSAPVRDAISASLQTASKMLQLPQGATFDVAVSPSAGVASTP